MPLPHHLLLLVVAATSALVGCQPESDEPAGVYESCHPHDATPCAGDAVCKDDEPDGMSARCTYACTGDEQCPASPSGTAVCLRFLTGAHCVVACQSDPDCGEAGFCEKRTELDGKGVALCR